MRRLACLHDALRVMRCRVHSHDGAEQGINIIPSVREMKGKYQDVLTQHLVSFTVSYKSCHCATPIDYRKQLLDKTYREKLKSLGVMIILHHALLY
jgi:hypothetical protein